ncbi:LuxR C-terminal-related transcriptional regulator [Corynebacterium provencense]|jgi:ATP/maltotriose-dependent transcriptional regulator MalT|uniref:LuxR C-terminal-related transcriptional regulator n=1 Tax=Corynebacterium provencense TaxID=1737425 RepID=UPI000836103C|nr:LuxR C-terminal-related transcriptional regulator [Corynebacterium provencense]MCI1256913.1 LuxR C-terminal-related transcriptional regulator [Corynebacterium provencense]
MNLIPPSTSTRFQAPTPVGRWVGRPRIDRLLEAVTERRLTLIHGPAGFGKSTLAAQWKTTLSNRDIRTAWLSLDEDDNSALWFLSHLTECLSHVLPGDTVDMLQILEDRPEDAERYLVPLLINWVHRSEGRTILFLDDWHLVTDERTRHILTRMVNYSGDQLGFIVTSRTPAGLPLTRLRVRDQLVEIDAQILRFDHRETRQFLTDIKGLPLSHAELTALYNRTEGWIAALQLTSLSLTRNPDLPALLGELPTRQNGIGEYLAENVLDLLDPGLLDFLMRTSVVSRISPDLASHLTGRDDAGTLLEEVLSGDLFLQRLDDVGEWYRYHHLFGTYLRRRLRRTLPDTMTDLHSRAAHWFHEHSMLAPAVDHALLAGETEFAVDAVEKESLLLVEHSRMATLLSLVDKLPDDSVTDHPWLLRSVAWAYCLLHFPDEANNSLVRLEHAVMSDRLPDDTERFLLTRDARVIRECLEMYRDRVSDDDHLQPEILDVADDLDPWTVSVAANVRTFNEIDRGRGDRATELQRWARTYHRKVKGSFSEVYGECYAGLAALRRLDIPTTRHHWECALSAASERSGRHSHAARLALGLLGKLHYQMGKLDLAEEELEESLRIGQRAGVVDFMVPVYESLTFIRAGRGDADGAELLLEQGEQAGRTLSLVRLWSRMLTVRARLGLEVTRPVLPPGASARERAFFSEETVRLDLALAMHSRPVPDEEDLTRRARSLIAADEGRGNDFQAMRDRILLAGALAARGARKRAESTLRDVVEDCRRSGLPQSLVDGGGPVHLVLTSLSAELPVGLPAGDQPAPSHLESSPSATGASDAPCAPDIPASTAKEPPERRPLNSREKDILRLVDAGFTNREIADRLYLGVNTVKWYLRNLYRALDVSSRKACVRRARDLGELVEQSNTSGPPRTPPSRALSPRHTVNSG